MNDEPDDFWQRVGSELEAEDNLALADQEATERVLGRLLAAFPAKQRRSSKRFVFLLVAAALLVASVAAATVIVVHQRRDRVRASEATKAAAQALASKPQSAEVAPTAAPTLPEPAAPPSAAEAAALPSPSPTAAASSTAWASSLDNGATPTPNSAAELLSAAGRARRKGYSGHAIALLGDLQARFPNSPEARASDVALGMLQLQSGQASAARAHFERYLQRSAQGALAADALWGRAQALFAQGNAAEARASLTTLLERYPSSAYASAARAKLRAP
jgi:TolA-binding protein